MIEESLKKRMNQILNETEDESLVVDIFKTSLDFEVSLKKLETQIKKTELETSNEYKIKLVENGLMEIEE